MPNKTKWTVLTYIAAHNNLDVLGQRSLREILKVGSTPELALGALYDGHQGAGRYIMGEPNLVVQQQQLGSIDSGSPDELINTAKWVFGERPAERYGLVLWSHGSGWEPSEVAEVAREARPAAAASADETRQRAASPGSNALFRTTLRSMLSADKPAERAILFDDGTGHSLDTIELARVVDEIAKAVGQPLELLGMDACLMANLEVAYELRKCARYLTASQELVPGHSWPYERIFGALRAAPDQSGADLAKLIVSEYVRYYEANPPGAGDVTKVALDLGKADALVGKTNAFADALLSNLEVNADVMWNAQVATMKTETRNEARSANKFQYHLWDAGTLTQAVAAASQNAQLKTAATSLHDALLPGKGPVLSEGHVGKWFDGIAGTSIYLPRAPTRVSPYYSQLGFAKDTRWGELVPAYREFFP
jgi:hypothetical protein